MEALEAILGRRSIRKFTGEDIPRADVKKMLEAAMASPSASNQQPWHFVADSESQTKRKIRTAAEAEEREFYRHRASTEWPHALQPLGTDDQKVTFVESRI